MKYSALSPNQERLVWFPLLQLLLHAIHIVQPPGDVSGNLRPQLQLFLHTNHGIQPLGDVSRTLRLCYCVLSET